MQYGGIGTGHEQEQDFEQERLIADEVARSCQKHQAAGGRSENKAE